MFSKNLISVPEVMRSSPGKKAKEWEIQDRISVALTLLDEFGYTLMVKVRVRKKHWWNRPWKNFVAHAPSAAEALEKGQEFLESQGYAIECDPEEAEEVLGTP